MPIIKFHPIENRNRTGSLPNHYSPMSISRILGVDFIPPNPFVDRIQYEWMFTIDGHPCCIWDYLGERWCCFGDASALLSVFSDYREG